MVELVVVDNSVLMPLIFGDEDDRRSRELILAGTSRVRLLCPALCVLEFGNALLNGLKRKSARITVETAEAAFAELAELPLEFRESPSAASLPRLGGMAMRLGLSLYDAVYAELALSHNAMLATLDDRLADAARAGGLRLWPWEGKHE